MLVRPQELVPAAGVLPVWVATGQPLDMSALAGRSTCFIFHTGPHHAVAARLVRDFVALKAAFAKLECELLAVSNDSVEALRLWEDWEATATDLQPASSLQQLPVLSDVAGDFARGFGLLRSRDGQRAGYCNAVILMDRAGRVRYSCLLEAHTSHSPQHILRKVAAFRAVETGHKLVMSGSAGGPNSIEAITVDNNAEGISGFYRLNYGKAVGADLLPLATKEKETEGGSNGPTAVASCSIL